MPITKAAIDFFTSKETAPEIIGYDDKKKTFEVKFPDGHVENIHEKVWSARKPPKPSSILDINPSKIMGVAALSGIGLMIHRKYKEIENDLIRRRLIEDLIATDPILRALDKQQVLEWYATIYHFAPKFSLDKAAVREVLDNFARFGRVDVNTIKMLAETEKARNQAQDLKSTKSWSSTITDLARSVTGD